MNSLMDFSLLCTLLMLLFQCFLDDEINFGRFIRGFILSQFHFIKFQIIIIINYLLLLGISLKFKYYSSGRRKNIINQLPLIMELNKSMKRNQQVSTLNNYLTLRSTNIEASQMKKVKEEKNMEKVRNRLQKKREGLENFSKQVQKQIQQTQEQYMRSKKKQRYLFQHCKQKRVDIIPKEYCNYGIDQSTSQQSKESLYYKNRQNFSLQKKFKFQILPTSVFYPPSCAAFDITFCKGNQSVYVYGGISCTTSLQEGLKQYFYQLQLQEGLWKQIKPVSLYTPMPRYGHTLTATQDSLLLFGGVSEYKEKLKDRCFYPDVWSFNIYKNNWKVLEFSGPMIRNRKSHSACIYNKYYIIYGGIDDSQQVISDIEWVNYEQKRSRWRSKKISGRFNHQMSIIQTQQGLDYLFIFGGRNQDSQIIGQLLIYPIYISEGELQFQQPFKINQQITPSQFPIMKSLQNGILIMGGIDSNNEAVNQCWFYDTTKQTLEQMKTGIDWSELRGAKAVSINGKCVYLLAGSQSKKYKGIKMSIENGMDEQFTFKI